MELPTLRAEDLPVGERIDLGTRFVARAEVVEFARAWDPLPLHVDEDHARGTSFGDVIGSGLHTLAVFQRLCAEGLYRHWAVVAGRSLDRVRFLAPLRPDATVRASLRVDAVEPDSPSRALVTASGEVRDESIRLLTLDVALLVLRRPQ